MSTTETVEEEFTVSDELYQITEATNADGTVDVEIYDWEKVEEDGEEKAKVWFYTPSMEPRWETMPWPTMDTLDNKFVRICETVGIGLKGADWLKSDGAKIRADPENWIIQTELPRRYRARRTIEQLTVSKVLAMGALITAASFFGLSLLALISMPIYGILSVFRIVPPAPVDWFTWSVIWILSFCVAGTVGAAFEE